MVDDAPLLLESGKDLLLIAVGYRRIYYCYPRFLLFWRVEVDTCHILHSKIVEIEIMKWSFSG